MRTSPTEAKSSLDGTSSVGFVATLSKINDSLTGASSVNVYHTKEDTLNQSVDHEEIDLHYKSKQKKNPRRRNHKDCKRTSYLRIKAKEIKKDAKQKHPCPRTEPHPLFTRRPRNLRCSGNIEPIIEEDPPLSDEERIEQMDRKALERQSESSESSSDDSEESIQNLDDFKKLIEDTPALDPMDLQGLSDVFKIGEFTKDHPEASEWIHYLENILILGYQVSQSNTLIDVLVAFIAYIKMHMDGSIVSELLTIISSMSAHFGPEEVTKDAWTAETVIQNWEILKTNTVYSKISYLMSAAMSLSVCKTKKIEFSILGLDLISAHAAKEQLKAFDVIDALLVTFNWMCETGYKVFEEKSLSPLLYADVKMRDYNERCDYVLAHGDVVISGNGEDAEAFDVTVDEVISSTIALKQAKPNSPTAVWLQSRYERLVDIKFRLAAKFKNTSLRFAPIGFHLSGPSGVGKSTLGKLTMSTSLISMGYPKDSKRIIVDDMTDEYDSSLTSDILGMYFDDVGQGKSEFTKKSPTDRLIKFMNNVAAKAVKAELHQKGITFVAFKVGVLTSNFEDFGARHFSDKPEAVLRRFYHVRVAIRPEYQIPGGVSLNTDHPDILISKLGLLHDVWSITIEEVFIFTSKKGSETYRFQKLIMPKDYEDGPRVCSNLTAPQYLAAVVYLSRLHKRKQDLLLRNTADFDEMPHCPICCLPNKYCKCLPTKDSLELLANVVQEAAVTSVKRYVNSFLDPIKFGSSFLGYKPIRYLTSRELTSEFTHQLQSTCNPILVALTPESLFQSSYFKRCVSYWQISSAMYNVEPHLRKLGILTTVCTTLGICKRSKSLTLGSLSVGWLGTMVLWQSYRSRLKMIQDHYVECRDALPVSLKMARESKVTHGAMAVASLMVCTKMYMIWRRRLLQSDGISREDMTNGPGWFGFMMEKIGLTVSTTQKTQTALPSQILQSFQKSNLYWADFVRSDGSATCCNIFFPRKSVAIFPKHVFHTKGDLTLPPSDCLTVKVMRYDGPGGVFEFKCSLGVNAISSKIHDLVFCEVANCPDIRDKSEWLPLTRPSGSAMATLLMRDQDKFLVEATSVEMQPTFHDQMEFYGGVYHMNTVPNGKCMSVMVAEKKNPCILGFHVGSSPIRKVGILQTLTLPEYKQLLSELSALPDVCLSALSTEIPISQYNIPLLASATIHKNSKAAQLNSEHFVEVYGSTRLRSMQKSTCLVSPISMFVTEVTGVPNIWGPPKLLPNWKAFNATLDHVVNPADMFHPALLAKARKDWVEPLLEEARQNPDEYLRPLTFDESIKGIDGVKFIDALVMSTSMGFPIFGPKNRYFDEDRVPHPSVKQEYDRLLGCWKNGERGYPVSTATLKDEPTAMTSEKVRVFQAAAVAMSLHIRRLFLPIARFLHLNPELSESAVGVNAFSHQWDQLMSHVETFDSKDMLAWDYSKYDVRMNSQVVRAVLISFIDIARVAGYSAAELHTMEMMIVDIAHPLLDWNGILMMSFNMNTSGNNITVDINGAAGSLYVRMGFFSIYPEAKNFRDHVAAMTYGDDFKGSVDIDHRDFNFRTYSAFLAKHKMKITLPSKSDEIVDFLDNDQADFLKRNSNYIPEIGCRIGALDEQSIFKSWHVNLKSKSQLQSEVACSCIESGLHEFFAHGREVYELRRSQAHTISQLAGLSIPATTVTFDERVEFWKSKYQN